MRAVVVNVVAAAVVEVAVPAVVIGMGVLGFTETESVAQLTIAIIKTGTVAMDDLCFLILWADTSV